MRSRRRETTVAAGLVAVAAWASTIAGCAESACPAVAATSGIGISAVDGRTDAEGRADLAATVCVEQVCREVSLAGEPSQRATLVAGFADLPLSRPDAATVRVTLRRAGASAGGPYDVTVHPVGTTIGSGQCMTTSYVASIVIDVMGAHEAPPPQAPGRT